MSCIAASAVEWFSCRASELVSPVRMLALTIYKDSTLGHGVSIIKSCLSYSLSINVNLVRSYERRL